MHQNAFAENVRHILQNAQNSSVGKQLAELGCLQPCTMLTRTHTLHRCWQHACTGSHILMLLAALGAARVLQSCKRGAPLQTLAAVSICLATLHACIVALLVMNIRPPSSISHNSLHARVVALLVTIITSWPFAMPQCGGHMEQWIQAPGWCHQLPLLPTQQVSCVLSSCCQVLMSLWPSISCLQHVMASHRSLPCSLVHLGKQHLQQAETAAAWSEQQQQVLLPLMPAVCQNATAAGSTHVPTVRFLYACQHMHNYYCAVLYSCTTSLA